MGRIKTQRFEVDDSSWNYDISSSIVALLEMIPEDDREIDVPDVLYKALSKNVKEITTMIYSLVGIGVLWEEVILISLFDTYPFYFYKIGSLHSNYHGFMFSIYDYLKEESIICFKPDTKRGKFKQSNIELKNADNDEPLEIIENSMSSELISLVTTILHSVLPKEDEECTSTQIACDIRTLISRDNTGLYQVVVSENCPLHYHIDKASTNVLCVTMGRYTVLIWKLTVNDEMLGLTKRFHWSERDAVNLLWITVLFAVGMYFLYICREISTITKQCHLEEYCDEDLLDTLRLRRSKVFVSTVMFSMLYIYFIVYKRYQQKHRLTCDKEVYETLLHKKQDFCVCLTIKGTCNSYSIRMDLACLVINSSFFSTEMERVSSSKRA